jgi:hypothetical protein
MAEGAELKINAAGHFEHYMVHAPYIGHHGG